MPCEFMSGARGARPMINGDVAVAAQTNAQAHGASRSDMPAAHSKVPHGRVKYRTLSGEKLCEDRRKYKLLIGGQEKTTHLCEVSETEILTAERSCPLGTGMLHIQKKILAADGLAHTCSCFESLSRTWAARRTYTSDPPARSSWLAPGHSGPRDTSRLMSSRLYCDT